MQTLLTGTQGCVANRREWLKKAKKALTLVNTLPDKIQNYPVAAEANITSETATIKYWLNVALTTEEERVAQVADIMSMWVKFGLNWNRNAILNYSDRFKLSGRMKLEGDPFNVLEVEICNIDKPPTCRLVRRTETREVEIIEAECIEDDAELVGAES